MHRGSAGCWRSGAGETSAKGSVDVVGKLTSFIWSYSIIWSKVSFLVSQSENNYLFRVKAGLSFQLSHFVV